VTDAELHIAVGKAILNKPYFIDAVNDIVALVKQERDELRAGIRFLLAATSADVVEQRDRLYVSFAASEYATLVTPELEPLARMIMELQ